MDGNRLAERLTGLGLTSYEARAFVALLARRSFTAAEVARHARLPRQRIYDVLDSLVAKGLASARPGTVTSYAATEPGRAMDLLIAVQRRQLARSEREAAEIGQSLTAEFQAGREHTDPLDYIEVLRDPGAINARFDELQTNVRRELLVFTKPPYARPPQENVEGLIPAAAHKVRSLYEYSVFDDSATTEAVRRFIAAGEVARFVPSLPLKLAIMDETIVMFAMRDPVAGGSDFTIVVIEHPSLATVLKSAFNAYWETGRLFEEAQAHSLRQSRSRLQPA